MDARDLCRGETRESRGFLPLPQVMVDTLEKTKKSVVI